jgi:hypothetical protein
VVIGNITTDDPWELQPGFVYEPIAVVDLVKQVTNEFAATSTLEPRVEVYPKQQESNIQSTMHSWTYSIADAVYYAERNYNVTLGSPFGYSRGENCQNFASQCVWAGLGSGTGITALPAVSTQRAGSNARNVWCRNQSTTHYSIWWFNWAWDNVRAFFKLIDTSTIAQEGPCGFVTYGSGLNYSSPGNVLAIRWTQNGVGHAATADTIHHAMFVTQVTATHGNQTASTIKIAAHSTPTNTAYDSLISYLGSEYKNASQLARAMIWNGWYTVPQPTPPN